MSMQKAVKVLKNTDGSFSTHKIFGADGKPRLQGRRFMSEMNFSDVFNAINKGLVQRPLSPGEMVGLLRSKQGINHISCVDDSGFYSWITDMEILVSNSFAVYPSVQNTYFKDLLHGAQCTIDIFGKKLEVPLPESILHTNGKSFNLMDAKDVMVIIKFDSPDSLTIKFDADAGKYHMQVSRDAQYYLVDFPGNKSYYKMEFDKSSGAIASFAQKSSLSDDNAVYFAGPQNSTSSFLGGSLTVFGYALGELDTAVKHRLNILLPVLATTDALRSNVMGLFGFEK